MINKTRYTAAAAVLLLLLQGCSSGKEAAVIEEQKGEQQAESKEPVTLTLFVQASSANFTEKDFQTFVGDPVAKKYPHITITYVPKGQGSQLNDLITAGQTPDIIYGSLGDLTGLKKMNLLSDLAPLIKSHRFDLGRLDPDALDNVKANSPDGQISFMPHAINGAALYYNKDLFDRFGVGYPKDGMTWDEVLDLTRQMSRTDNGAQYRGFGMDQSFFIQNNQLSLLFADPATKKALVNGDGWFQWFTTMKRFYEIDNNKVDDTTKLSNASFLKDKTTAMWAGANLLNVLPEAMAGGLQWDMVTLPSFREAPGIGIQLNAPFYSISPTSKHKVEAFQVIEVLLSDEVQLVQTKLGKMTTLKNQDIRSQFASDLSFTSGKNVKAMFAAKAAKPMKPSYYDASIRSVVSAKFGEVMKGAKDVNTALREAEDEGNKVIQELATAE
ncbi:extracellular solute-binding protein [Paenibacillus sp. H1-7]|uniref:ABC transporter substrate-binding protein n=1 Tax=Paenibacillus sp. H1-7 TaxID=2282849 RepID=UPI001EF78825|nr:extracellular solute-binding protein [Paenibacillus sp. H1-7]